MASRHVITCDICKTEHDEDMVNDRLRISGPVTLDFKHQRGTQNLWKWDHLCYPCADVLRKAMSAAVKERWRDQ